jgi:hypothetical protein
LLAIEEELREPYELTEADKKAIDRGLPLGEPLLYGSIIKKARLKKPPRSPTAVFSFGRGQFHKPNSRRGRRLDTKRPPLLAAAWQ